MAYMPGTNTGHGHVWERPDGVRARCGGPGLCKKCAVDQADRLKVFGATPKIAMPLSKALHILATIHTRDDDVTGFVVEMGASPHWSMSPVSQHDYIRAWEAVRAHIHLQTEPQTK